MGEFLLYRLIIFSMYLHRKLRVFSQIWRKRAAYRRNCHRPPVIAGDAILDDVDAWQVRVGGAQAGQDVVQGKGDSKN